MEVIVGTYEELTLGYRLIKTKNGFGFNLSFTNHTHAGCVKVIASSATNMLLATGSTDETICLFNLRTRKEVGTISQYEGAITSMQFYDKYLFTSNGEGHICIWEKKKWECLKTLQGHKDEILCLSIHPSGKLALSVSKDKTLKTWNLIAGRSAYTTNIHKVSHIVQWSPDGTHFAVVLDHQINIYKLETAEIIYSINTENPVLSIIFIKPNILAIGEENGNIVIHDFLDKSLVMSFNAHTKRVKGLCCVPSVVDDKKMWLVSASSDGYIKVWRINWKKKIMKVIAEINTTFRLTCVTAIRYQDSKLEVKEEAEEVPCLKEESTTVDVESAEEGNTEKLTVTDVQKAKIQNETSSKKKKKNKILTQ